jgi:hypothetical protein
MVWGQVEIAPVAVGLIWRLMFPLTSQGEEMDMLITSPMERFKSVEAVSSVANTELGVRITNV